jgi:hypothetical protein
MDQSFLSLKHDAIKGSRIMLLSRRLGMIFSENRHPLFPNLPGSATG